MGHGDMQIHARLWAVGSKTSEVDDDVVLALAA
jgi:hypothetical protein